MSQAIMHTLLKNGIRKVIELDWKIWYHKMQSIWFRFIAKKNWLYLLNISFDKQVFCMHFMFSVSCCRWFFSFLNAVLNISAFECSLYCKIWYSLRCDLLLFVGIILLVRSYQSQLAGRATVCQYSDRNQYDR